MTNKTIKLITSSTVLASLLLTGCGESIRDNMDNSTPTAHFIKNRTAVSPATPIKENVDQWQNYNKITTSYDMTDATDHKLNIDITFEQGISNNAKHFQIYLDTDFNASTGWSYGDKDMATVGADYMIEDGSLYKSTSNTAWKWDFVDKVDFKAIKEANNLFNIKITGSSAKVMSITDIENVKKMNISVEPVDANWEDTNNFVSNQVINIQTIGAATPNTGLDIGIVDKPNPIINNPVVVNPVQPNNPVVEAPVVEVPVVEVPVVQAPELVNPEVPLVSKETIYEDAENSINANWVTIKGQFTPQRKTPGFKNNSKAFVKLQNEWVPLGGELWENKSEYQLPMNNDTQKILSIDVVGDGEQMQHYTLGVKVTTEKGERTIQWDSFYNHENLEAKREVYPNGEILITFPSPVELVRGYEFSDPNLNNHFQVDIEKALRKFEPNNRIVSVDTFVATGGNLDNIKLLSK